MWKYLLAFVLSCVFVTHVNAHSQDTTPFGGPGNPEDAITLTGVKVVPITVGNLNKSLQAYEIYVEEGYLRDDGGKKVFVATSSKLEGTTSDVAPGLFRKLPIPIKLSEPNKPLVYQVCSVSVAKEGDMFRSKICTLAKLYWSKK